MRRLLPVVCALVGLGFSLSLPAEETAGAGTPAPASATLPATGILATTSKRANVRYGPNTNSRIACTLNPGDTIEIVGPAPVPDWYVIRFPQKGTVWVNDRHLQAVDGGKRWKVTADGVNARDDATLKSNIVSELAVGEIIEDRNSSRGNWHAVYIPSAVAYVHKSVINVPDAANIKAQVDNAQAIQAVWLSAQVTYTQLYKQVTSHPESAVGIDWSQLQGQLEQVIKSHPDAAVRLAASRIHDGIELVQAKSRLVADNGPSTPAAASTGGTTGGSVAAPAQPGGTTATDPGKAPTPTEGPMHTIDTSGDQKLNTPADSATGTVVVKPQTLPTPDDSSAAFDAIGFVSENTDYPKVGAPNLLLDSNSNVVAFLVPKAGSTVNLAEYYWRWVGVKGALKDLDPALHGIGKKLPLIEVDTIHLVKQ
jgi:uncharacterized protein YgiM (DUF1202 family)